jgi:adenylate cyclase class 2
LDEIEVKIIEISREQTERKLLSLGARKISDRDIETLLYDFKDGSIRRAKSLIRLRNDGQRSVLTFKKLMDTREAKVADEYEVLVSDLETMKKILESLGLSAHSRMRKHRTTYVLDGTRIEFDKYLDEYDYVPEFLEIEAKNVDAIYECARLLGYEIKECRPWTTMDLINHYSTRRARLEGNQLAKLDG